MTKLLNLNTEFSVDVVGNAYSVKEGNHIIGTSKADVVFLDVELADGTGFDLLQQHQLLAAKVIFITAHEAYLLRALRASAFDFLLKPIKPTDLYNALKRVSEQVKTLPDQIENLIQNINGGGKLKRISISSARKVEYLEVDQIVYCKANSQYTELYLKDGSMSMSSKHLGYYDELLEQSDFFRVHRSYLINMNCVKEYHRETDFIVLQNQQSIKLSHHSKAAFLKRMEGR